MIIANIKNYSAKKPQQIYIYFLVNLENFSEISPIQSKLNITQIFIEILQTGKYSFIKRARVRIFFKRSEWFSSCNTYSMQKTFTLASSSILITIQPEPSTVLNC